MTATSRSVRPPSIALWLAFVALAAQLGLGWISAHHHAQMLAAGPGEWTRICTQAGIADVWLSADGTPSKKQPPGDMRPGACAICSAAGLAALPPPVLAHAIAGLLPRVQSEPPTDAAVLLAPRTLRPPPRGPPAVS